MWDFPSKTTKDLFSAKEVMFFLSACQQDYRKSTGLIFMNLGVK